MEDRPWGGLAIFPPVPVPFLRKVEGVRRSVTRSNEKARTSTGLTGRAPCPPGRSLMVIPDVLVASKHDPVSTWWAIFCFFMVGSWQRSRCGGGRGSSNGKAPKDPYRFAVLIDFKLKKLILEIILPITIHPLHCNITHSLLLSARIGIPHHSLAIIDNRTCRGHTHGGASYASSRRQKMSCFAMRVAQNPFIELIS